MKNVKVFLVTAVSCTLLFIIPANAVESDLAADEQSSNPNHIAIRGKIAGSNSATNRLRQEQRSTVQVSWLKDADLAKVGEIVPIEVLDVTMTSPDGSFEAAIEPSNRILAAAERNGGWVNLDINVTGPVGQVDTTVPRHLTEFGWTRTDPRAINSAPDGTTSKSTKATEFNEGSEDLVELTPTGASSSPSTLHASGATARAVQMVPCGWKVTKTQPKLGKVINFHSSSNANYSWKYGQEADSMISIGVRSPSGKWGLSGTTSVSGRSSSGGAFSKDNGKGGAHYFVSTNFEARTGKYVPVPPFQANNGTRCIGGRHTVGMLEIRTLKWLGAGKTQKHNDAKKRKCNNPSKRLYLAKGLSQSVSKSKAQRVSHGITWAKLDMGMTSGYSKNVSMKWKAQRGPIHICGSNGLPNTGSKQIIYVSNA